MSKKRITIKDFECSLFGASRKAGVYAICNRVHFEGIEDILYIGSSKNIHKRVYNRTHPYKFLYEFLKGITYIKYFETTNYKKIEIDMIKMYCPKYNIQHNG